MPEDVLEPRLEQRKKSTITGWSSLIENTSNKRVLELVELKEQSQTATRFFRRPRAGARAINSSPICEPVQAPPFFLYTSRDILFKFSLSRLAPGPANLLIWLGQRWPRQVNKFVVERVRLGPKDSNLFSHLRDS